MKGKPDSLVSAGGTVTIGPGLSQKVVIRCSPTSSGSPMGALDITSSGPARHFASVMVCGRSR